MVISCYAQSIDEDSRTEVILADGTRVVMFRSHVDEGSNIFYYLPVNMHISVRDDRPEISLLQFNENGQSGAILHFLITWGLSESGQKEANMLLNLKLHDTVIVAGPVLVEAAPESFLITGNDRVVTTLNNALRQKSQAPLLPGQKLAASFRFGADDSDYLAQVIRDRGRTISGEIRMIFIYRSMIREGYIFKATGHEWVLSMNLDTIFNLLRN
jgi:hypothetical protein